jgi:adenylate kinase
MKIVLLGSPGVGKGTYASMIRDKYHLAHISTGDLFREAVKNKTDLGKKAKEFMDKGELVPDELTLEILKSRLKQKDAKDFLLDGFPRTIKQAEALEKITKIDLVLNFYASEKVILQRLTNRRICKKCGSIFNLVNKKPLKPGICDFCGGELYQRADEKPEIIKDRLKVYAEKTRPLEDYYKKKGLLREINADVDMNAPDFKEKVLDKIEAALDSVKK